MSCVTSIWVNKRCLPLSEDPLPGDAETVVTLGRRRAPQRLRDQGQGFSARGSVPVPAGVGLKYQDRQTPVSARPSAFFGQRLRVLCHLKGCPHTRPHILGRRGVSFGLIAVGLEDGADEPTNRLRTGHAFALAIVVEGFEVWLLQSDSNERALAGCLRPPAACFRLRSHGDLG